MEVAGLDVSAYAIENSLEQVRPFVQTGDAVELPYADAEFDLVVSVNTLHNLRLPELERALREIGRVSRGDGYVVVDAYRSEREKANLLYWQLTCECFFTPQEWEWIFARVGYRGDYDYVVFD